MPSYRIVNGAGASVTGTPFFLGRPKIPITIRVEGDFTSTGAAAVSILTSADSDNSTPPAANTFFTDFGEVSGTPSAETTLLTGLVPGSTATIRHPIHWIRADTGALTGGTPSATVWLVVEG